MSRYTKYINFLKISIFTIRFGNPYFNLSVLFPHIFKVIIDLIKEEMEDISQYKDESILYMTELEHNDTRIIFRP